MLPKSTKQILAITGKVKKGCNNPGKAKAKINQIKTRRSVMEWLAK